MIANYKMKKYFSLVDTMVKWDRVAMHCEGFRLKYLLQLFYSKIKMLL